MSIHLQYETARRWARFARQAGARFDVEQKAVASCPALRTGEGSAIAVGQVQPKHLPWLLPLVEARAVRCYATAVTGGTTRRPTRGCNSLPRTSVGVAFTFHTSGCQSAPCL